MQETNKNFETIIQDESTYILKDFNIANLSTVFILKHSAGLVDTEANGYFDLEPQQINLNYATFIDHKSQIKFPEGGLQLEDGDLKVFCTCPATKNRLCEHLYLF